MRRQGWSSSGDWFATTPTNTASVSAFYYVLMHQYMADIASALNKSADAAKYLSDYESKKDSYHKLYFDDAAKGYTPCAALAPHGTQTGNSMALALGLPRDPALAKLVAQNLRDDVISKSNHSDGGIVGMVWLFPALQNAGFGEFTLNILLQDTYPRSVRYYSLIIVFLLITATASCYCCCY